MGCAVVLVQNAADFPWHTALGAAKDHHTTLSRLLLVNAERTKMNEEDSDEDEDNEDDGDSSDGNTALEMVALPTEEVLP